MPETIPLLLDVDPGVDDALALILALRSPEAQVLSIGTVAGNVPVEVGTENALKVVRLLDRQDVPVARGCEEPLLEPYSGAERVHGTDGLGNSGLPPSGLRPSGEHAVDQLLRVSRERPGELVVVALGPLTNLATALDRDPDLAGRVREVVVMGGAFRAPGNVTPTAEFNINTDPEAAARVFSAGWPLAVVGLDVTRQALLTEAHVRRLAENSGPVPDFVRAIVRAPMGLDVEGGQRRMYLHDPLALAIALDPTLATEAPEVPIAVELGGTYTRGTTIADFRPDPSQHGLGAARARVCLRADVDRFLDRLMGAFLA